MEVGSAVGFGAWSLGSCSSPPSTALRAPHTEGAEPTTEPRVIMVEAMATKPGFFDYITAAFNARPIGMFVAPNWVGLAAFGLLGITNPGFWVLGAGLELGYLLTLATNRRFQNTVSGKPLAAARTAWNQRIANVLERLDPADIRTYDALAQRCRSILDMQMQNAAEPPEGLEQQAQSLGRLSWMFLRLMLARRTIGQVMGGAQNDAD